MDGSLRIKTGLVIEVNDAGETITIHVENEETIKGFYDILESFEAVGKKMEEKEKELNEKERLEAVIIEIRKIKEEIDGLFGKDCCKKVFGDIVPSPYCIAEFFDQLIPIFEKYSDERQKKIAEKYSRNRKGTKRNKYRTKEEIIQDAMR